MTTDRRRWLALVVVCLAQLMIVLDTTIVNVALPSIQRDLHFTQGNLTWVINAFLVTFGSFLLLAGRLGDLIGRKRVFLFGVTLFTLASLLCGAADSSTMLIAARFIQGIGAAMQASVILAIIVIEFPEPADRARAMSAYVFTAVAGGSLGLLAGGVLTQLLSWHWIFFVNLPIGIIAVLAGRALIPNDSGLGIRQGVDWLGSLLVTLAIGIAVYAIVEATTHGWGSTQVIGGGGHRRRPAGRLHRARVAHREPDHAAAHPQAPRPGRLVPDPRFPGHRHVRHLVPRQPLPRAHPPLRRDRDRAGIHAVDAHRRGALDGRHAPAGGPFRRACAVMVGGLLMVALGLYVMHGISLHTDYFPRLLIGFFLMGLGVGNAFMPMLQIAMEDVPRADAGLGSGIVNVSQQVSGSAWTGGAQHLRDQPHQLAAGEPPRARASRCSAATAWRTRSGSEAS